MGFAILGFLCIMVFVINHTAKQGLLLMQICAKAIHWIKKQPEDLQEGLTLHSQEIGQIHANTMKQTPVFIITLIVNTITLMLLLGGGLSGILFLTVIGLNAWILVCLITFTLHLKRINEIERDIDFVLEELEEFHKNIKNITKMDNEDANK